MLYTVVNTQSYFRTLESNLENDYYGFNEDEFYGIENADENIDHGVDDVE